MSARSGSTATRGIAARSAIGLRLALATAAVLLALPLEAVAAAGPEIDLQRPAGASHACGTSDNLGLLVLGQTESVVWTVANLGDANSLNVGTPVPSNRIGCTASIATGPSSPVGPLSSTIFTVDIRPFMNGPVSFDLTVPSDDADEGTCTISVGGYAFYPEFDLQRPAGTSIACGTSDYLGVLYSGQANSVSWTIANLDSATGPLTVDTPVVTNNVNCSAWIAAAPSSPVPILESTTFIVDIQPVAVGPVTFDLTVPNNDPDEGNCAMAVSGDAVEGPASVALLTVTAERAADGVRLRWQTGAESACGAFTILRCDLATGRCDTIDEHAELPGPVVPCLGDSAGWVYEAVDATAAADTGYSYYLREYETTGGVRDYGPALVGPVTGNEPTPTPSGAPGAGDGTPQVAGCAVVAGSPGVAALALLAWLAMRRRRPAPRR